MHTRNRTQRLTLAVHTSPTGGASASALFLSLVLAMAATFRCVYPRGAATAAARAAQGHGSCLCWPARAGPGPRTNAPAHVSPGLLRGRNTNPLGAVSTAPARICRLCHRTRGIPRFIIHISPFHSRDPRDPPIPITPGFTRAELRRPVRPRARCRPHLKTRATPWKLLLSDIQAAARRVTSWPKPRARIVV